MPYLIDGHNLIPHIPGLSLRDLDDEIKLIQTLQQFAAKKGTKIEVYFDQAQVARNGSRNFGLVRAHFIHQGSTADQAIIARLARMGKDAKNWTVVTSDREILVEARGVHSQTKKSSEFAALLQAELPGKNTSLDKQEDPEISAGEVDYWLGQFKQE